MFDLTPRALAWLRVERGLQQKELADRSGVGRAAISRYESGKASPSLENLGRLLEALGVGPKDLARCLERLREDIEGIPASGRWEPRRRPAPEPGSPSRGAYVLVDLSGGLDPGSEHAERAVRAVAQLLGRREGRG